MRAIVILGAFQAGVMLANVVRVKIVAVELGPAGLGLLTLIEQIVVLAALACTLSLPFAAVKFLSFAHSQGRLSFVRAYVAFRRALTVLSVLGFGAALLIAAASPGIFGPELVANRQVLLVALVGIPLLNLLTLLVRALAASGRSRAAAGVTLAQAVALAVGAGTGVVLQGSLGYFVGGAAGMLAVLLAATLYLRGRERTSDYGGHLHTLSELRGHPGILRFALVHSVIMLTTPFAFLVARYAVLADAGLQQVGLLAAAFGISQSMTMLLTPANALFLTPALNRGDVPSGKLERALHFRRSMLLAIGAALIPLLLFPHVAVNLLFAPEFAPVAAYVYIFLLGEALGLLSGVHQALLIGLDDFSVNVAYIVAGQVLLVGLVIVLVPAIGIPGVGIALIADNALVLGLTTWRLRRRHAMAMLRGLLPFVPVAAGLAAVGALVPSLPGDALVLVAKSAVLVAFVVMGIVLARVTAAAR